MTLCLALMFCQTQPHNATLFTYGNVAHIVPWAKHSFPYYVLSLKLNSTFHVLALTLSNIKTDTDTDTDKDKDKDKDTDRDK